jgi:hypothetical protein
MREALLDACALDWAAISPAIFGALFQSIMDRQARRNLGAHYTSEENILKLIKPLFLDALWGIQQARGTATNCSVPQEAAGLTFFDPACGSAFLRHRLRGCLLELEILRAHRAGARVQAIADRHLPCSHRRRPVRHRDRRIPRPDRPGRAVAGGPR